MGDDERPEPPDVPGPAPAVPLEQLPLHSTNLLTALDPAGTVLYESPSIERILGFGQDELVGDPVAGYFHPDDRGRVVDAFERVVAGDASTVEAVRYRHERADGSFVWVESVAWGNPMPDGSYVVNTRDVSERRAREEDLERSNERLDEFASVVSHDLKNPLNVARGRLELARETGDRAHLDDVARAHDRMEALIDDLLDLARAGSRDLDLEWVDVGDLAEACWRTVATADAELVVDIDREAEADRLRLRQLVENLVGNAVTYGGPAVTVTVHELAGPSGFAVADDGPGIDEGDRDRVFEAGYSTREDGTGVGLGIVADIAEAHGWSVRLTDSSDGGAQFELTGVDLR